MCAGKSFSEPRGSADSSGRRFRKQRWALTLAPPDGSMLELTYSPLALGTAT